MKKLLFSFTILLISLNIFAQANTYYWVQFNQKNSFYSVDHPEAFLSQEAIQRRQKQHILIDESDLPLNQSYVNQINDLGAEVSLQSKWMNGITIKTDDESVLAAVRALAFVKEVKLISLARDRRAQTKEKFEPLIQGLIEPIEDSFYGTSFNQIHMLSGDTLHAMGYMGQGMRVGVFDGGFTQVDQYPAFEKLRSEGRIHPVWNYPLNNNDVFTLSFHGSAVMSVLTGYAPYSYMGGAPLADYYLFVTEDVRSERLIEEYNWAVAAERADSMGIDVFTTSLGYSTFDDSTENHTYADMNGHTTVITQAANLAASKGILVVNSAGNEGNSSWHYITAPADGDLVLGIGAVKPDREIAGFSSRGPSSDGDVKPNICTEGANIPVYFAPDNYSLTNGTSFSGPLAAAMSTCLWQAFPNKSSQEVFNAIEQSAHLFPSHNDDYGYGIPNMYYAYQILLRQSFTQLGENGEMQAFPNPVSDQMHVVIKHVPDQNFNLRISDLSGKSILSKEINMNGKNDIHVLLKMDEQMMPGIYILSYVSEKKVYSIKFQKLN